MEHKHQQFYTLIIRLWQEQLEPTSRAWRGTLECLQTREMVYFQSLSTLAAQIARLLDTQQEGCEQTKSPYL